MKEKKFELSKPKSNAKVIRVLSVTTGAKQSWNLNAIKKAYKNAEVHIYLASIQSDKDEWLARDWEDEYGDVCDAG